MRTVVVTVAHGRHDHLATQRQHLARLTPAVHHVVVAVDDPGVHDVTALVADRLPTTVVDLEGARGGLPVAAARNAGVEAALDLGADLLVLLDVDCVPGADLVSRFVEAAATAPGEVFCGPVTYLDPAGTRAVRAGGPFPARRPHAARPDPAVGTRVPLDTDLFWSLNVAMTAATWRATDGFYEGYVGYGGEDTDFAHELAARGTALTMVGGADAWHQFHPVSSPPVEHTADIVRNGRIFRERHGVLPMAGWFDALTDRGLVADGPDGLPVTVPPARVTTVPARHPYVDAVLPPAVHRAATDRIHRWEPDPLFDTGFLARHAHEFDAVHVHFGYEHLGVDEMRRWVREVRSFGLGLVVTVHDLRNPHQSDRSAHDAHLRVLVPAADVVLTLTPGAADECERRFGRRPEVLPHPTLLTATPGPTQPLPDAPILIPLKALRPSVPDPVDVVTAVAAGSDGRRVQVLLDPKAAADPRAAGLQDLPDPVDLVVAHHLPDADLHRLVADAHAVVLPYRFGTHSGWVELARDLGTHVVVPDHGWYAQQHPGAEVYCYGEAAGLDTASLTAAARRVSTRPPAVPASRRERLAARDVVRAAHDRIFRDLLERRAEAVA